MPAAMAAGVSYHLVLLARSAVYSSNTWPDPRCPRSSRARSAFCFSSSIRRSANARGPRRAAYRRTGRWSPFPDRRSAGRRFPGSAPELHTTLRPAGRCATCSECASKLLFGAPANSTAWRPAFTQTFARINRRRPQFPPLPSSLHRERHVGPTGPTRDRIGLLFVPQ